MSNDDRAVMGHWMEESLGALNHLRQQRDQHERALEAAMDAIRRHTEVIENLERDIEIIQNAVAQAGTPAIDAPVVAEDDGGGMTQVHVVSTVRPPSPPPLRPVAQLPRAVGER